MKLGKFNLSTTELVIGGLVLGGIAYTIYKNRKDKGTSNFVNASGSPKKTKKLTAQQQIQKNIQKYKKLKKAGKKHKSVKTEGKKYISYIANKDVYLFNKKGNQIRKKIKMGDKVLATAPFIDAKDKKTKITILGAYKDSKGHLVRKNVLASSFNPYKLVPPQRFVVKKQLLVAKTPTLKSFKIGDKVTGVPFKRGNMSLIRIDHAYKVNGKWKSKDIPASYLQSFTPSTTPKKRLGTMPKRRRMGMPKKMKNMLMPNQLPTMGMVKPKPIKGTKTQGMIVTPNSKMAVKIPSRIKNLEVPLGSKVSLSGEDDFDTPTQVDIYDPNVGHVTRVTI
jgi:hypothetical protein